jgi:hypothetical protein
MFYRAHNENIGILLLIPMTLPLEGFGAEYNLYFLYIVVDARRNLPFLPETACVVWITRAAMNPIRSGRGIMPDHGPTVKPQKLHGLPWNDGTCRTT